MMKKQYIEFSLWAGVYFPLADHCQMTLQKYSPTTASC